MTNLVVAETVDMATSVTKTNIGIILVFILCLNGGHQREPDLLAIRWMPLLDALFFFEELWLPRPRHQIILDDYVPLAVIFFFLLICTESKHEIVIRLLLFH